MDLRTDGFIVSSNSEREREDHSLFESKNLENYIFLNGNNELRVTIDCSYIYIVTENVLI